MTRRLHRYLSASPLGPLEILSSEQGLCGLLFEDHRAGILNRIQRRFPGVPIIEGDPFGASAAVTAWLNGQPKALDGLPIDPGGTPFQNAVWTALRAIPFSHTRTYGQLADLLGRPGAARAVGSANGANPLPLVVPCHRVVGANGSLTGFAFGLNRKRWLLDFERRHV